MSYVKERRTGTWSRHVVVALKCDCCGRVARGQAASWWRMATWPSTGPRRKRIMGVRRLHLCSPVCLLQKLGAMTHKTRVRVDGRGSARTLLRGLTLA